MEVDVESNLDVEDNAARKDVDEGAELVTDYEVNAGDEDTEDNDSDCFGHRQTLDIDELVDDDSLEVVNEGALITKTVEDRPTGDENVGKM